MDAVDDLLRQSRIVLSGQSAPQTKRIQHGPGVQHAVFHSGSPAAGVRDLRRNLLRFRQMRQPCGIVVTGQIIINKIGFRAKQFIPDKAPCLFHLIVQRFHSISGSFRFSFSYIYHRFFKKQCPTGLYWQKNGGAPLAAVLFSAIRESRPTD